jgi:hypothetical protein
MNSLEGKKYEKRSTKKDEKRLIVDRCPLMVKKG